MVYQKCSAPMQCIPDQKPGTPPRSELTLFPLKWYGQENTPSPLSAPEAQPTHQDRNPSTPYFLGRHLISKCKTWPPIPGPAPRINSPRCAQKKWIAHILVRYPSNHPNRSAIAIPSDQATQPKAKIYPNARRIERYPKSSKNQTQR